MQGGTALANIQLAKNLLQLRQEHHYTQKQLGDKLNITHQAYSYYETGHRDPNIDMLTKLSALYGFSIEQLLTVPCSIKNSFAKESANTYHTGLIITTGDTIYLTEEEAELLIRLREASDDDRKLIKEIPHHLRFRFFLYFFSFYPFLTDLFQRSSCRKYSFPISLPDGSYE